MDYKLLTGNCLDVLSTLPDNSVQCVVTSPPYFGLRDYGTAQWEGGDLTCEHKVGRFTTPVSGKQLSNNGSGNMQARDVCPHCGARRIDKQIGLEPTLQEYVAKLVSVFQEIRRVLRDDGVAWLNLGDSYYNYRPGNYSDNRPHSFGEERTDERKRGMPDDPMQSKRENKLHGLKEKDLIGVPWRVAFALQDEGWWLRQDIIWAKGCSGDYRGGSVMPESVKDRCTKAHEYVFMLTKSARYFFDSAAIQEPNFGEKPWGNKREFKMNHESAQGQHGSSSMFAGGSKEEYIEKYYTNGRNRRSVWVIGTKPYKGAHFATMPVELADVCIKASSRLGDTVLDPFNGVATTGVAALQNGRSYIGIELNPEYVEMSHKRLSRVRIPLLMG